MGSKPSIEQKSALDPALANYLRDSYLPRLNDMFSNPVATAGPQKILGESAGELGIRETAMKGVTDAASSYGFSPLENSSQDFLRRTIGGEFLDPTQSPVFKSIADMIQRKSMESSMLAGDQLNANFAGAGHWGGSGPLLDQRRLLGERTGQNVADTMAQYAFPLYQQNLGYQQNALPLSMQFGNLGRELPLGKLNLMNQAYTMAGMPRNIEQMQLDSIFKDMQAKRSAILEPYQLFSSLLGGVPGANSVVSDNDPMKQQWVRSLLGGGVGAGTGALTGASIGAAGGPIGMGGGAAIGTLLGLLGSFIK